MISLLKNEKTGYKLISVGLVAAIIYFVAKIVYAGIIAFPYPKEILEPANVALTNLFIEGKNPYTVESLFWEVPGVNYDYPFLNSLVASFISRISGCNALAAHFALSLFSILASGFVGFLLVKDIAKTTVAPLLVAILLMFCHWRYGYISAAPDDFGLLLFLLTMLAAVSKRISNKPFICAVGTTLCFYTKQYYVFVCVPIFFYMLLYSRKSAIKLFLWTLFINVAIALSMWYMMPLYRIKALLFTYLGTVGGGGSSIITFIEQFRYLVILFAALFAILIFALSVAIVRIVKKNDRIKSVFKVNENDVYAMCVVNSVVMLLPLMVIGRNDGAFISYFLQLWMPSIGIIAIMSFESIMTDRHQAVYMCAYAVITALTVYFGFRKLPLHILTDEEVLRWEKAYAYTREYSIIGDVFYSRSLAYDGFIQQKGEWQCGHEGEVSERTIDYIEKNGIPLDYFPYIQDLVNQNVGYRDKILTKASKGEYSLISFETDAAHELFSDDNCKEYGYRYVDTLTLQVGNMPYDVVFYAK